MNRTRKLAPLVALVLMAIAAHAASSPRMPSFFARRDYTGLGSLDFIQAADTNGDGIPDLVALAVGTIGTIRVDFGNGDGTFRPGPGSNVLGGDSFVPSDVNGDGKTDLVIATGNSVVITLGNGDGTFQSGTVYPINDTLVAYLVIGDFNGDGIPDIAAGGQLGLWLLTGKGGGTFNSAVLAASLQGCFDVATADFNGDGKLDVVATRLTTQTTLGFAVLLGNGNGTFQPAQLFTTPIRPVGIAVGSLTKGGAPSIVLNETASNRVYLYFGNGAGGFVGPKLVSLPSGTANGLALADLNGDGLPDLASDTGYVAYGIGGGNFSAPVSYVIDPASAVVNITLADLRNNGQQDIIIGGLTASSVLLNLGRGAFEDGVWTTIPNGAGCGVKGDFNGDGKPDLAVNNSQGISVLLGTANGAKPFTPGTNIAEPGSGCLVTGDLNGDGKPDLLVPVNGTAVAYLGNGDGTFRLASTTPTRNGGFVVLGDFNHDGKLDFATSGNILALGNGDGTFRAVREIVANPPSGGYSGIAAGDINNDGWTDLVLTSNAFPTNATATVLVNNHKSGFVQAPTNFGALTFEPILADLNGDGNLDLVLSGTNGSAALLYLGNGKGSFTSLTTLPGPPRLSDGINWVADVNGDGIPDVLVLGADTMVVYLGAGGGTYATGFGIGTGPAPGSILVENLHGQSPKLGLPDIVVPDTSGGVMVLVNITQ